MGRLCYSFFKQVRIQRFIFIALVVLAQAGLIFSQSSPKPIHADEHKTILKFGGDHNYPPYLFLKNNEPSGFDADLIREISSVMGIEAEIRLAPWNDVRHALDAGEIDVIAGMVYTEEREQIYDFSIPYNMITMDLFVRERSKIRSLDDARNKELIVQEGGVMHDYLIKQNLASRIITQKNVPDVLRLLSSGKYDAAFVNRIQGQYFIQKYSLSNIFPLGEKLQPSDYCFAVKKGNAETIARLNEGLNIIKATGKYRELYEKWFGVYEKKNLWIVMRYFIWALSAVAALLAMSVVWTWVLQRKVKIRTAELRQVIDLVPHMIFATDKDGRFLLVNRAMAEFFGKSINELTGVSLTEFFHNKSQALEFLKKNLSVIENGHGMFNPEEIIERQNAAPAFFQTTRIPFTPTISRKAAVLGVAVDITEQRKAIEARQESEERFRAVFEKAAIGIARSGLDGHIHETNKKFQNIMGYSAQELASMRVEDITHPDDMEQERRMVLETIKGKREHYSSEKRFIRKDGQIVWAYLTVSLIRDTHMQPRFVIGMVEDITDRKRAEERIQYDTLHDSLTGLPNRVLFLERLDRAINKMRRAPNYHFAVLYLDLDDFNKINDSLGHLIGDELLLLLARRLLSILGPDDTIARLSTDEFAILLDAMPKPSHAIDATQKIFDSISGSFNVSDHDIHISASIGVVHGNTRTDIAQEYLRDASTAMYEAKHLGKNRHIVFDPSMHEAAVFRLTLEEEMRSALRKKEFIIHYQPIIELKSGLLTGFEALARWAHPVKGMIPPDVFIRLAEETGLIVPLEDFIFETACRQVCEWRKKWGRNIDLHLNLSVRQFSNPELDKKLEQIITDTGLAPSSVQIEITEGLMLEVGPATHAMLDRLKQLGFYLCLDDFGTGYSSLSYLTRLPLNALKVDRIFVSRMTVGEENLEIIRAVRALARTFNLNLIAEGVETEEHLLMLKSLEYQHAQGYFISEPMDASASESLLLSNKKWL